MNATTLFKVKGELDHPFAEFMQITEIKLELKPVIFLSQSPESESPNLQTPQKMSWCNNQFITVVTYSVSLLIRAKIFVV